LVLFDKSPLFLPYPDIFSAYDKAILYARDIRFEQTLQYSGRFKLLVSSRDKTKSNQNQDNPGQYLDAHEKSKIDEPISSKEPNELRFPQRPHQYNGADPLRKKRKVNQLE